MLKHSPTLGVLLGNIPTINFRNEFVVHLQLLRQPEFRNSFRHHGTIQTPFFTWHGSADEALSLLLQRAILGLESWIVGAAWLEFQATKRLKGAALEAVRRPSSLGRSMVDNYYRRLPAMVYEDVALDRAAPALWERTRTLYREIRNPLMHGHQVDADSVDGVLACFEHLAKVFRWTDTWHDWLSGLQHPPKTPPVHIMARRLQLTLPLDTPLGAEDTKVALGDFVRDGRCSAIPEDELGAIQTLADLLACARRHEIAPQSSV